MCGIAGIFSYSDGASPVDQEELRRISERMAQRGPDGHDQWIGSNGRVGLAHRRLSIIDLGEQAKQPMFTDDKELVVVFNGEIFNYREIRRDLELRGIVFRSNSDTEVLLHLYRQHGEAMVNILRGMYAFAIWDAKSEQLFLARDPFGIKPLYFSDDGRTFRFASQVKALTAGGKISTEESPAGVAGFFLWGHVPEPWTFLKSVKALPAGTSLIVRRGQSITRPTLFFDLREEIIRAEDLGTSMEITVEDVLSAVTESVKYHLISDVPVGVFLSAGRDSTLLASIAARELSQPIRTVTLGFGEYEGTESDEVPVAEKVARLLSAQHKSFRITRADFEYEYERILSAMDQPSIDGVNTFFVSRGAAQTGLKVALSGLGGDELFGGYSSFRDIPALVRRVRAFEMAPFFGRSMRFLLARALPRRVSPKWAGIVEYGSSVPRAYLLRRSLFMPWELPKIIDPDVAYIGLRELEPVNQLERCVAGIRSSILQTMCLEMSCYMRNQLLRDADWAGMAHSLEIRVPLVDVTLLRHWLPAAIRALPFDRQSLLRAASPTVGALLDKRPKTGFSIPVQSWQTANSSRHGESGLRSWSRRVAKRFWPSRKKRSAVMLLTDGFGGVGGIAKFNRDVLRALDAMPDLHEISAYPRLVQRAPESVPSKVRYHFAASRGKVAYVRALLGAAFNGRAADIVLCGHMNLLPLAWTVSRFKRCPLLLFMHGIEAWQPHANPLTRLLLRRVDYFVAVSRFTAERMADWSGIPSGRVSIVPNCIDFADFSQRPPNPELAARLGIDRKRVLLTVARLASSERYKGIDMVLEVLPDVARDVTNVVYLIVGDGDDRQRLEDKARSLGVAERLVFTGYVTEETKKDIYALADVYVMPSRGEGFGIVFLEAMAMGVPAIGGLTDGSREALLDGKLGRLVHPDDRDGLVRAIHASLQQPRGRPPGLEHFDAYAFRRRLADLVDDIVTISRA